MADNSDDLNQASSTNAAASLASVNAAANKAPTTAFVKTDKITTDTKTIGGVVLGAIDAINLEEGQYNQLVDGSVRKALAFKLRPMSHSTVISATVQLRQDVLQNASTYLAARAMTGVQLARRMGLRIKGGPLGLAQNATLSAIILERILNARLTEANALARRQLDTNLNLLRFHTTVSATYMKQNLALQYRQIYAQKDLVSLTRVFAKMAESKLEAIKINTSIPDIQKSTGFLRRILAGLGREVRTQISKTVVQEGLVGVRSHVLPGIAAYLRTGTLPDIVKLSSRTVERAADVLRRHKLGARVVDGAAVMGSGVREHLTPVVDSLSQFDRVHRLSERFAPGVIWTKADKLRSKIATMLDKMSTAPASKTVAAATAQDLSDQTNPVSSPDTPAGPNSFGEAVRRRTLNTTAAVAMYLTAMRHEIPDLYNQYHDKIAAGMTPPSDLVERAMAWARLQSNDVRRAIGLRINTAYTAASTFVNNTRARAEASGIDGGAMWDKTAALREQIGRKLGEGAGYIKERVQDFSLRAPIEKFHKSFDEFKELYTRNAQDSYALLRDIEENLGSPSNKGGDGSGPVTAGRRISRTHQRLWRTLGRIPGLGRIFKHRVREIGFVDVYVRDRVNPGYPLVSAEQFEEGLVTADGAPVRSLRTLTQPIIDPRTGQVLITQEDLRQGLVDINNRPLFSRIGFFERSAKKIGKWALWKPIGGTARLYGAIPGFQAGAVGAAGRFLLSKRDRSPYIDVYRKDQMHLGHPLVTARQLREGLVFADGSRVLNVNTITQPVLDPRTKETLISDQDIEAGLVDSQGTSITKHKGVAGAGKLFTTGLLRLMGVDYKSFHKNTLTKQDIYQLITKRLDHIYDLLDARMPPASHVRPNGYRDHERRLTVESHRRQVEAELEGAGRSGTGRLRKLSSLLGLGSTEADASTGPSDGSDGGGITHTLTTAAAGGAAAYAGSKLLKLGKGAGRLVKTGAKAAAGKIRSKIAASAAEKAAADATEKAAASAAEKAAATAAEKTATSAAEKTAAGIAAKATAKFGGKEAAKLGLKFLIKKLPFFGLLAGGVFGAQRAFAGDYEGAAGELGSGLLSTVPGPGTAASVGVDVVNTLHEAQFDAAHPQPLPKSTPPPPPSSRPSSPGAYQPLPAYSQSLPVPPEKIDPAIRRLLFRARLNAYGATEAQADSIRSLETQFYSQASGGPISLLAPDLLKTYAARFGFTTASSQALSYFSQWLNERFLPAYGLYARILNQQGIPTTRTVSSIESIDRRITHLQAIHILGQYSSIMLTAESNFLIPSPTGFERYQTKIGAQPSKPQTPLRYPSLSRQEHLSANQPGVDRTLSAFSDSPLAPDGSASVIPGMAASGPFNAQNSTSPYSPNYNPMTQEQPQPFGGGYNPVNRAAQTARMQYAPGSRSNDNTPVVVPDASHLGSLSAHYESGSAGSSSVSADTAGTYSYGKYQINSGGTMQSYLRWVATQGAQGQQIAQTLMAAGNPSNPASGFSAAWRQLAQKGALGDTEQQFIKATHYDVAFRSLSPALQAQVTRSKALQQVLWSTAVQHGPAGASRIFNQAGTQSGGSDQALIKSVYIDRSHDFSNPTVAAEQVNRYRKEEAQALAMEGSPNNTIVPAATPPTTQSAGMPRPLIGAAASYQPGTTPDATASSAPGQSPVVAPIQQANAVAATQNAASQQTDTLQRQAAITPTSLPPINVSMPPDLTTATQTQTDIMRQHLAALGSIGGTLNQLHTHLQDVHGDNGVFAQMNTALNKPPVLSPTIVAPTINQAAPPANDLSDMGLNVSKKRDPRYAV